MEEDEGDISAVLSCGSCGPCELATTAAAAGNAWLITSAANSSGVEGLKFWL